MKHLFFVALLFIGVHAFSQTSKKDTVVPKPVQVPVPQPEGPKMYYLVLTSQDWNKIIEVMEHSEYPSNEIQKYKKFILENAREVKPPTPDGTKKP